MNLTEALAVVELVDVHWPKAKLGDETKKSWASLICRAEPNAIAADGYEAIRDLAAHQGYPPSVAEVILGVHGARLSRPKPERLPESRRTGPTFAEFAKQHPDGVQPTEAQRPAFGEPQTYCDHDGEPEVQSLPEYLKLHPHEAERIKALKVDREHADSPVPAALTELLKMGGVKPRSKWDRAK